MHFAYMRYSLYELYLVLDVNLFRFFCCFLKTFHVLNVIRNQFFFNHCNQMELFIYFFFLHQLHRWYWSMAIIFYSLLENWLHVIFLRMTQFTRCWILWRMKNGFFFHLDNFTFLFFFLYYFHTINKFPA